MKQRFWKHTAALLIALTLGSGVIGCSGSAAAGTQTAQSVLQTTAAATVTTIASSAASTAASGSEPAAKTAVTAETLEEFFSDSDWKEVTAKDADAEIVLSGSEGTLSDSTRGSSGSEVVITSKGVYRVTGSSENVTIVINDENESGNIYLLLDNVSMTNASDACIRVDACDKLVIRLIGENTLTYTNRNDSVTADGAIYSKDDVTINGDGTLNVSSALHGIVCNDDLKLTGGTLYVEAGAIGLKAGDSLRIADGAIAVQAGHDGVQVSDSDGDAYFYMAGGSLTVSAGYDGIDVGSDADSFEGFARFDGGTVSVTAGGGSSHSQNSSVSQKGIKCDGAILLNGATVACDAADDAIHAGSDVTISGGTVTVASSDDGIHADNALTIDAGEVTVTKSYEGLEGYIVTINGGTVQVAASDDGINAAGGSDSQSSETWSWGGRRGGMSSSTGTMYINGGTVYVNASGDGLDSNGSLYVTGGLVIVEGPTNSGNGALDVGDGAGSVASITGGTVLAVGASGMAVNFNAGTQCSGLVSLSGGAGSEITVDDGSGFTFTASKSFQCVVYSSPYLTEGGSYTVKAGSSSAPMQFTSGLYYGAGGGFGGRGGFGGNSGGFGGRGGRR